MNTCKIKGCKRLVKACGLCAGCYESWLSTGELPGPIKDGRGHQRAPTGEVVPNARYQRLWRRGRAVIDAARKWTAHDEKLAAAIAAWEGMPVTRTED